MANNIELETLRNNEIDANKRMVKVNVFTAIVMLIVFMFYVTKLFPVYNYTLIYIFFPINIALLLSSLIWVRGKRIYLSGYKYFLLFSFLSVVGIMNMVIPKHALLGYACVLFLANHYYNTKVVKIMYVSTLIVMLIALYGGMFCGEYDANLLTEGIIKYDELGNPFIYQPNTTTERYEFLHELIQRGNNRYVKILAFYYFARASFLTILFFISIGLTRRSHKLFRNSVEIKQEQEKMSLELNIAKEIQLKALPSELVQGQNVDIVAELNAAKEVGGDFYDYYKLDDEHIAITIGDVSGKGVPAAMFMMKTITTLKTYTQAGRHPSEILKDVNRILADGNDSKMFVTCFLGILNTTTGELEYSNAGHNRPIIGSKHKFRFLECNPGFILGALEETVLFDEKVTINKGDIITLYTDGITEARNIDGDFYGDDRLINFYNKEDFDSLIELQYKLKDDVKYFVNEAPQADDMTVLILEYRGDIVSTKQLEVTSKKENLEEVLEFSRHFVEENKISQIGVQLELIIDELFSNVNKYAYGGEVGLFFLRLSYNKTKHMLSMTFIDHGPEFNPLKTEAKIVEDENAKEGGLGILIVKNFADSITYNRINNKNILLIKKLV